MTDDFKPGDRVFCHRAGEVGMSEPLFGEPGRRTVATEWGVRWIKDIPHVARRGTVEPAASEAHARHVAAGMSQLEAVSRRVVTYMGDWSAS